MKLARGEADPGWRTSFLYHYNYEKQFPYTPNVRGVRTERWKYIRYVNELPLVEELFDLKRDPLEERNLVAEAKYADTLNQLRGRWNAMSEEWK